MSGRRRQAEDLPQIELAFKEQAQLRTSEACLRLPLIIIQTKWKSRIEGRWVGLGS